MCNRLGTCLFWGVMIFVLLFLAAALSMPAHAGTVGVDNVGLWLNITGIALFWIISLWPVGSLLTVVGAVRIVLLAALLFFGAMVRLFLNIEHGVAMAGLMLQEVGNAESGA